MALLQQQRAVAETGSAKPCRALTNTIVRPSSRMRVKTSKHFCAKAASPTPAPHPQAGCRHDLYRDRERESNVHARGVVLSLSSSNSRSSAKSITASYRARASRGDRPIMMPLSTTLSRAARSALKPTPSSDEGERRPCIPDSAAVHSIDPGPGTSAGCSCHCRCARRYRRTRPCAHRTRCFECREALVAGPAQWVERALLEGVGTLLRHTNVLLTASTTISCAGG